MPMPHPADAKVEKLEISWLMNHLYALSSLKIGRKGGVYQLN